MKTVVVVGLIFVGCCSAAEGNAGAARIEALRESFRYAEIIPTDESLISKSDSLVVLETLTVVGAITQRALAKRIQDRWARARDAEFEWYKGGLWSSRTYGRLQADIGSWVEVGEKTTGVNPSREIFVKVELLRLRW